MAASPNPVLTEHLVTLDASKSHDPFDGTIVDYQWDPNGEGNFELDTGSDPEISWSYSTSGIVHPQVRVTNELGLTATTSIDVDVRPTPPPGEVSISINNGNYATNRMAVQLYVVWPAFASMAKISNDGGFNAAGETKAMALAPAIPWTLRSGGRERLSKIVYMRLPDSAFPTETFSDDMRLSETS